MALFFQERNLTLRTIGVRLFRSVALWLYFFAVETAEETAFAQTKIGVGQVIKAWVSCSCLWL